MRRPPTAFATARAIDPVAGSDPSVDAGRTVDARIEAGAVYAALVPPRDSDVHAHREWLARSSWPEVVFAAAR